MITECNNTTLSPELLAQAEKQTDPMLYLLQWLCAQIMDVEVSNKLGALKSERTPSRTGFRSGFCLRKWDTRFGTTYLVIPKVREGGYVPFFLVERKRSEQALVSVIQQAYIMGVSTRKMDKIIKSMGIEGISRSQVSELTKGLQ